MSERQVARRLGCEQNNKNRRKCIHTYYTHYVRGMFSLVLTVFKIKSAPKFVIHT